MRLVSPAGAREGRLTALLWPCEPRAAARAPPEASPGENRRLCSHGCSAASDARKLRFSRRAAALRLLEGTRAVVLGKAAPISSRWRPQNVAQNLVEGVIVVHLVTFIGFAAKVEAKAGLAAGLSLLNHATSKRQLIHKYPDKKLAPEANAGKPHCLAA